VSKKARRDEEAGRIPKPLAAVIAVPLLCLAHLLTIFALYLVVTHWSDIIGIVGIAVRVLLVIVGVALIVIVLALPAYWVRERKRFSALKKELDADYELLRSPLVGNPKQRD